MTTLAQELEQVLDVITKHNLKRDPFGKETIHIEVRIERDPDINPQPKEMSLEEIKASLQNLADKGGVNTGFLALCRKNPECENE